MNGNKEKHKSIADFVEKLCNKKLNGNFLKTLAESVGASSGAAQKFFAKYGTLPTPSVTDLTKIILEHPELGKVFEMCPVDGVPNDFFNQTGGDTTIIATATTTISTDAQQPKKRKKKNKKKKSAKTATSGSTDETTSSISSPSTGILRPRNFLEAALYFSSITMSTVEMATDLEPESFFAPPLLLVKDHTLPFDTTEWLKKLQKPNCSVLEWEQHKAMQRRTISLFAVALLQTTNPNVKFGDRNASVLMRSNYLKRAIGLYAISLVDHLPPTLSTGGNDSFGNGKKGNNKGNIGGGGISTLSHFAPQRGASPILLANRKVDLNDLKVPNPHQLTAFWEGLTPTERISILRGEQTNLQKGWIGMKKSWCLCKYCRTRTIRLADVYEVLYRSYHDDLDAMATALETRNNIKPPVIANPSNNATTPSAIACTLKPKQKRNLFKQLSLLADDIIDERGYHYQMVMKRLGKAYQEEYDWGDCEHGEETCESCARRYYGGVISNKMNKSSMGKILKSSLENAIPNDHRDDTNHNNSGIRNKIPIDYDCVSEADCRDDDIDSDDVDDDGNGNTSDEWEEEELEVFYKDLNFMEDENIIQTENELVVDPSHLSTLFPDLYDPRLYTMPRPNVPAYSHHHTENDRMADGAVLYERFASLLFQFHLVPKYLEAEALIRQRKLLEEEDELERLEEERAKQKAEAKQKKKERQKALKQQKLAAESASILLEKEEKGEEQDTPMTIVNETIEPNDEQNCASFTFDDKSSCQVEESICHEQEQEQEQSISQDDDDDVVIMTDQVSSNDESIVPNSLVNLESLQKYDDEFEAPPGLSGSIETISISTAILPPISNNNKNGIVQAIEKDDQASINMRSTWFDRIFSGTDQGLLWSPIATKLQRELDINNNNSDSSILGGDIVPPGFDKKADNTAYWSPFATRQ